MGVAALDTYLHAAALRSVRAWKPTAPVARVELRFGELCDVVEGAVEGRRQDPNSRPWVLVKDGLQERLLKMTFQSSRSVESALSMRGVNQGWNKIAAERGIGAKALKQRLDEFFRDSRCRVDDLEQSAGILLGGFAAAVPIHSTSADTAHRRQPLGLARQARDHLAAGRGVQRRPKSDRLDQDRGRQRRESRQGKGRTR